MQFRIKQGKGLRGEITLPGDKSISHRAIMLASLADGRSEISGVLEGEDCFATIDVFQKLGVDISRNEEKFIVEGKEINKEVNTFTWEKLDCIDEVKQAFNL